MTRRDRRRVQHSRFFEALEPRQLMSTTAPMIAQPTSEAAGAMTTALPPGSASVTGFTPSQIRHAFGMDAITFGSVAGDGSGQTIAIINAFDNPKFVSSSNPGFANSDLHKFDVQFGLPDPPSFKKVDQFGGTNYPTTDSHWANETALDVEWAHAAAPKANILLVEARSASLDDLITQPDGARVPGAVEFARQQPGVSVITMSFAAPEGVRELLYDPTLSTPLGHSGETFVAATGDKGAPGGYPAFSPSALAVGGTSLSPISSGYSSETAWSSGGGGISTLEEKPAYQALEIPGGGRLIPDVSFDADPNTGVAVYDSFNGGSATPWFKIGGTSLATPVWSALIGIANQGRALKSLGALDGATQTLPRMYELNGSDFHDITTGNEGFPATAGYDLATGRGTPKANTLVPHLAGGNSISGTMFVDTNGNGKQDSNEYAVGGWGTFVDINNNGVRDGIDFRVFSDPAGHYTFSDMPGGTFHLFQVMPSDWKKTTTAITVTLNYGTNATGRNIGNQPLNRPTGTLAGYMFDDLNGNGIADPGEPAVYGWGCYLDQNNDGVFDGNDIRVYSDGRGIYQFNNLPSYLIYHLRQNTPTGWRLTSLSGWPFTFVLMPGETALVNIYNAPPAFGGSAVTAASTVTAANATVAASAVGGSNNAADNLQADWRQTLPSLASDTLTLAEGQTNKDGGSVPL